MYLLPLHIDAALHIGRQSEHRLHGLTSPGAHQTCKTDDLAPAQLEAGILNHLSVRDMFAL